MKSLPLAPEWSQQTGVLLAWPHLRVEWGQYFDKARAELAHLCSQLQRAFGPGDMGVFLLVHDEAVLRDAKEFLPSVQGVEMLQLRYSDIWLRDTAPVFASSSQAFAFRFNGWGEKYLFEDDVDLAKRIAIELGIGLEEVDLVCEGGALEHNGSGTFLSTRVCLFNKLRNPTLCEDDILNRLAPLGAKEIVWVDDGLINDHTDGHIDTLLRFGPEDSLVVMKAEDDDPNKENLDKVFSVAEGINPARMLVLPSPKKVVSAGGELMPASYCNSLFLNGHVFVPTYSVPNDALALSLYRDFFPQYEVVEIPSYNILSGGGAVHCVTQQIPQGGLS